MGNPSRTSKRVFGKNFLPIAEWLYHRLGSADKVGVKFPVNLASGQQIWVVAYSGDWDVLVSAALDSIDRDRLQKQIRERGLDSDSCYFFFIASDDKPTAEFETCFDRPTADLLEELEQECQCSLGSSPRRVLFKKEAEAIEEFAEARAAEMSEIRRLAWEMSSRL